MSALYSNWILIKHLPLAITNKPALLQFAENENLCKSAGCSWPRETLLPGAFVWFYCDSSITRISSINIYLSPLLRMASHPPCLSGKVLPYGPSVPVTALLGLSLTETWIQLKLLRQLANCGLLCHHSCLHCYHLSPGKWDTLLIYLPWESLPCSTCSPDIIMQAHWFPTVLRLKTNFLTKAKKPAPPGLPARVLVPLAFVATS